MKIHIGQYARLVLFALVAGVPLAAHAAVPVVPDVPGDLSPPESEYLLAKRELFSAQREAFLTQAKSHNQRCHDVPLDSPEARDCAAARDRLTGELAKLQQAADALNVEIGGAVGRAALAEKRRAEQMVTDISHGAMASLPPDFPRIEEIENSPGIEAWRRGMDAAMNHDWQLALAWFKMAQQKDPGNAALGRAVELAQWTWDERQKKAPTPESPVQHPKAEDLQYLFPQTQPLDPGQLPTEDDMKYLFPGLPQRKASPADSFHPPRDEDLQHLFPQLDSDKK